MWKKIKQFFSDMLEKAQQFWEKVSDSKVGKTVRTVVTSTQSGLFMKGWMITDFIMDLMLFSTAWFTLSGLLRIWVVFCILVHVFMIVREFVIVPVFSGKKIKDGKLTYVHGISSSAVIDHDTL